MSDHNLKTVQPYFDDVLNGAKTFEVRKNDRGFAVGDALLLEEYVPMGEGYTGQAIIREVTYVLDSPEYCKPGYVVLGINNPTDARRLALTADIPLDRLEALCAAEREGRCVVLPCKVGDAVWLIAHGRLESQKVRTFFVGHPSHYEVPFDPRYYMARLEKHDVPLRNFGKTVFLTRVEAEAATRHK